MDGSKIKMKKKATIYIALFFIFLFSPIKSIANTVQCNLFIDKLLLSSEDHEWEKVIGDQYLNDFGFNLQMDWNYSEKKAIYRKDENSNFIVGKLYNLDLAQELSSGDLIIKLNNKKFENSEEQKIVLKNDKKINIEFYNETKGNFVLDLVRNEHYLTDAYFQIEDISINSIDQKSGTYEFRFIYNFSKLYGESYKVFNKIADNTIVYNDNGTWNIEVCVFTEEEFERSKIIQPGFEIKILDIAKKNNDLFDTHYKITPYAKKYGNDLHIQWAIDGATHDVNWKYREGVDFNKAFENMKSYTEAGGRGNWWYLIFDWNWHQIPLARKLANSIGTEVRFRYNTRNTGLITAESKIKSEELLHEQV